METTNSQNRIEVYKHIKDELHKVFYCASPLSKVDNFNESERVQILEAMNAMNLAIEAYKESIEN